MTTIASPWPSPVWRRGTRCHGEGRDPRDLRQEGRGRGGRANYLHRGIAARAFERRFDLADYIKVADAKLENGLLSVELVREVPEAKKPRSIKITSAIGSAKVLENEAA